MDDVSGGQTPGLPRKLLFVVNVAWFFRSHRLPIAVAAIRSGFEVHLACNPVDEESVREIAKAGIILHNVPFSRSGSNLFHELRTLWSLVRLVARLRPDVLHLVTAKPVLYGSFAGWLCRTPATVNALSGLGNVFTAAGLGAAIRRRVVTGLYAMAFAREHSIVVLQNDDDLQQLSRVGAVSADRAIVIRGSGVDLAEFTPATGEQDELMVLLPARLLWSKGVGEFVEAARRVHQAGVPARFVLAGALDPDNSNFIPELSVREFLQEGTVEWAGKISDMVGALRRARIVCLPSYYGEGVPKALIEAAACGKPIVTTDSVGCRDVVRHNWNGLLVKPRDSNSLFLALMVLLTDREKCAEFGRNSRLLAEQEFGIERVTGRTLGLYEQLLSRK